MMQLFYGKPEDIENWMELVSQISWNFPGLETQEKLDEHKTTVLRFIGKRQAICVKDDEKIVGVMLFSRSRNMICCLGVSPDHRRRGVASMLMDEALRNLDRTGEISVSTFRADDEKGLAPRALYQKYGFIEDELIEAMGYPNQKYILRPIGNELGNLQKGSRAVKTIEIRGANAYQTFSKTRVGCRGIVIKDSLMLISQEINTGWYLIPGGGLEDGETTEECCVREIREETGYIVKPVFHFLTMNEYYEEYKYVSYYFLCEIIGKSEQNLTVSEIERGVVPEWAAPEKMLEMYAKHEDFAAVSEEKRGAYLREYMALTEYFRIQRSPRGIKIEALPKEKWKGAPIPLVTRSDSYYDLEMSPLDRNGCTVALVRKPAEKEIVHTPEEYDFPDSLYQDHWEKAEAYGVLGLDGALLACIEVCPEEWSNRLMVTELWVSDEFRRQGIGKRLMDKAKEIALRQNRRAVILETQSCNTDAIGFYLHEGFELIGFDTCCYTNNDIGRREVRLNLGYFFHREERRF